MNIRIYILMVILQFSININWCDNNNYNYCTVSQNQFLPKGCEKGESIMAAISTISDLYNIRNKGDFPEITLSPQLLICLLKEDENNSCDKGFSMTAVLDEIKNNGLVDDTCLLFKGDKSHCPNSAVEVCDNNTHLKSNLNLLQNKNYTNYKIKDFSKIEDHDSVTKALNYGPIICSMGVPKDFYKFTSEQANFKKFKIEEDFFFSIVGLEKKDEKEYFIVRASYGEQFGDFGFFKSYRNENLIKECYKIKLDDENKLYEYSFNKPKKEVKKVLKNDEVNYIDELNYHKYCMKKVNGECKEYRNILSPIKSQANTGNCWAFAAATALQDRIIISQYRKKYGIDGYKKDENQKIEKIILSEQSIVNFFNGGSGTGGGDMSITFSRLKLDKWNSTDLNPLLVTRKTCTNFLEADPKVFRKDLSQLCASKNEKYDFLSDKTLNYLGFKVKDIKVVRGAKAMKEELKSGPLACTVNAGSVWRAITELELDFKPEEVITLKIQKVRIDHGVVVIGYGKVKGGKQNGMEYWIIKNSWSVGWHDSGLFKLQIGKDNFGIEANCSVPYIE